MRFKNDRSHSCQQQAAVRAAATEPFAPDEMCHALLTGMATSALVFMCLLAGVFLTQHEAGA